MRNLRLAVTATVALASSHLQPSLLEAGNVVKTIAGSGKADWNGDGDAKEINVGGPFGVAIGPDGALYVCETTTHVVRRVDLKTGSATTVAGNGTKGYSGDSGPATKAQLNEPYEVRFDQHGNMFFVEMRNHIVRRVDAKTGVISTVAGTGEAGFSGDGGPATKARMKVPHSITLDHSGNLYICDIGNHRVRVVDLKSGKIQTLSGTGEKKQTPDGAKLSGTPLNGPRALDFDGKSNLYLALREGNAVYRIDLKQRTLHHIAGTGKNGYAGDGGPAKKALLSGPKGIAISTKGDVYLADTESHTIRVIRAKSGKIETIVGNGKQGDGPDGNKPLSCQLARPHGVFVDGHDNVYIGDSSNHKVRIFELERFPNISSLPLSRVAYQVAKAPKPHKVDWKRIKLDDAFRSEGAAAADVNKDGLMDVFAGDVWYEAPDWKVHAIRNVGKFVAGKGYSNSFVNFAYDVNQDGWDDLILLGFPGAPFHWYENPQNKPGHWKEHVIWHSVCNESPEFEDVDGDGKPELVFGSQPERQMGVMSIPPKDKVASKWTFNAISEPGDPGSNGTFKYYHGIGVGDVNNDGRNDVMIPHGWWEAPAKAADGAWTFHSAPLSKEPGQAPVKCANMYCEDLDLDGDQDIICSSAHTYGVWWFENVSGNKADKFKYHLIDESYSQTHAVEFVDINGDGQRDIVTGKRFFAHNGGDPGGKDAVVMYWYEIHRKKEQAPKFIPHEIEAGRDTGVGTQFQVIDFNGDKRPDIVLSNKKGVNVLLQK